MAKGRLVKKDPTREVVGKVRMVKKKPPRKQKGSKYA